MTEQLYADAIITWLGAVGVWFYFSYILRHRTNSSLEGSIMFLLFCLFFLLFVRGFYWLFHYQWLGNIEFAFAALLPLSIVLFGERLIRRHLPLYVKVIALLSTVFFEVANLLNHLQASWHLLIALMATEVVIIVVTGLEVMRADKSSLTKSEKRFNNALIVAATFAAPLLITDFREEIPWIPCRLGSDGALIFVYTCVRMSNLQDSRRVVFWEIGTIIGRAVLIAASFMAISGHFRWTDLFRYLPLSLAFVLLYSILYRLKAISIQERGFSFFRWLLLARSANIDSFLSSLRHLPLTQEHMVLREKELEIYDLDSIFHHFGTDVSVLNLPQIRATMKKRGASADLHATEQLVDMLERYQMSHACLVSKSPPLVLLFRFPLVVGTQLDEMKLKVIVKIGRILQNHSG